MAVPFIHRSLGEIVISDNIPLSESKLFKVLDDNLTPADWLALLNARVFFFPHRGPLMRLTNARENRGKAKDILVVDTEKLAASYANAMDIAPINTGNTNHAPARRGLATFAPLLETDYATWRRRRAKKTPDTIKEVSVRQSILDISVFVVEVIRGEVAR